MRLFNFASEPVDEIEIEARLVVLCRLGGTFVAFALLVVVIHRDLIDSRRGNTVLCG